YELFMTNDNIIFQKINNNSNAFNPFNKSLQDIQTEILSKEALNFLLKLHLKFDSQRKELLTKRDLRTKEIDAGTLPGFLPETEKIRNSSWQVASCPKDLEKRHVEITGPADAKMIINALNSGADVFMADLEDALSPTWENIILGQKSLKEAVNKTLKFENEAGKTYQLADKTATLLVRPRGLHLIEKNLTHKGEPLSASLVDFGLYFFHNAKTRQEQGSAPYFYLPKMESHLEARWWNDIFNFAQEELQIPKGSIRVTMLIETCMAALEMDEMLYELKDHTSGLNAGRWDYIFSFIKKFKNHPEFVFPDRNQVTMTTPFMQAYSELIVKTCHRRGAHAIGGMAAFIPNRKEPEVTEAALIKVKADKTREAQMGFDGTWVAHPDLVAYARAEFEKVLGNKANQKEKQLEKTILAKEILNTHIEGGKITEAGVRTNVNVALLYLDRWLHGTGAAALYNLMEDAATAEISRSELWQWRKFESKLDDGRVFTADLYNKIRNEEVQKILNQKLAEDLKLPIEILDALVLGDTFHDFLTSYSYKHLN
ncbi:MAG: malate synthase A, partial [Bdellovibrionales bacterium]|nr:malate synthase A [Bdellovibrionales bacterium]